MSFLWDDSGPDPQLPTAPTTQRRWKHQGEWAPGYMQRYGDSLAPFRHGTNKTLRNKSTRQQSETEQWSEKVIMEIKVYQCISLNVSHSLLGSFISLSMWPVLDWNIQHSTSTEGQDATFAASWMPYMSERGTSVCVSGSCGSCGSCGSWVETCRCGTSANMLWAVTGAVLPADVCGTLL